MVVTRATNQDPLQFDPEIERNISRLRREVRSLFKELPFDSDTEIEVILPFDSEKVM